MLVTFLFAAVLVATTYLVRVGIRAGQHHRRVKQRVFLLARDML